MKIETIVVTGSIGSGKSKVLKTIRDKSEIKVGFFSFDEFTRDLYQRDDVKKFLMMMMPVPKRFWWGRSLCLGV